jgi:hypothetical protein
MIKDHELTDVRVCGGILSLVVDDSLLSRDLKDLSPVLRRASDQELTYFEVSPSGYGIHWPRIDEGISIDGLLGITHAPDQSQAYRVMPCEQSLRV